MPEDDDLVDWRGELRSRGLRLTPQRELVFRAVEELGHATPDEVLALVQRDTTSLNQSTVYRTLDLLASLGAIRHTHLTDRGATYHAISGPEHFHLKCRDCGAVTSVRSEGATGLTNRLEQELGFEADVGHLAVFGWCASCRPEHDR